MVCTWQLHQASHWSVSSMIMIGPSALPRSLTRQYRYPRKPRPRKYPNDDPMNSGGGDVKAAGTTTTPGQPLADILADSSDDEPDYPDGFSTPHCPDVQLGKKASNSGTGDSSPNTTAPKDNNACHGISGDYWVMSRDVAVSNVQDFCSQTEHKKTYNPGSVNELELSVTKNGDDSLGPKDAPDCVNRFQNAVIDGCDGTDPVNNPHNYKFGSTLTTADGWEYKMTPLSKQVNEINCDVSYKFFFDRFEIRGKNLPDALLGANGEGLHNELDGCGALTAWQFERTPDDCCFQWYATGQLPVGTKACVGRAVMSAGGSGKGHCKRYVDGSAIDDWPGYGDEGRHVFKTKVRERRDSIDQWPGYGEQSRHRFRKGRLVV